MSPPIRSFHKQPCKVDGCDTSATHRAMCMRHYMKWRRTGSPVGVIDPRTASIRGLIKRRSAG